MPKRPHPDDDNVQPIKKQLNNNNKSRKIRSLSSERTLQLLYEGAMKFHNHSKEMQDLKIVCSDCSSTIIHQTRCSYCEKNICPECKTVCYKCTDEFCQKCSFSTYDQNEAVCYSCSS